MTSTEGKFVKAREAVLHSLRQAGGEVVTTDQIRAETGYRKISIPQYILALRHHLKAIDSQDTVENVHGVGFRLRRLDAHPAEQDIIPSEGLTPAQYRDALVRLGFLSGAQLSEELKRLGDSRPMPNILRAVQSHKARKRTAPVPWFMVVIVRLLERERSVQQKLDAKIAEAEALRESLEAKNHALRDKVNSLARRNEELSRMLVAAASKVGPDEPRKVA